MKRPRPSRFALKTERLEDRRVLAAYPAFVDGVFTFGDPTAVVPYGSENTFLLESLPGADKTIYLDFDGHHSVGNSWGHNIQFPAFTRDGDASTFNTSELREIQHSFQNVAEDFIPFGINVTTKDPGLEALRRTGGNDTVFGVRAVATQPTNGFGSGSGGIALVNSFNDSIDNPVFAFNKGARNGGMTLSHEVGHALGLGHDGLNSDVYHPGAGFGATGWGPLMGAPFGKIVTQWSDGDYAGATNLQDDLAIITKPANGFTYRSDDFGNSTGAAHQLVTTAGEVSEWGIVERNTDVDYFEFETGQGSINIDITPFTQDPNLDILAKLYDDGGNLIEESNPLNATNATFSVNLDAGTYFVSVEGTGRDGVYTDYGSLGYYTLTGTVVETDVIDGDFNDDGFWNEIDIDLLVAEIAGAGSAADLDLTGDGSVDLDDRDAWLAEAGGINLASGAAYLLGDLDLNGVVDGQDFVGWNNNKFTSQAAWSAGDFNADGFVNGGDFVIWNDNKFSVADTAAPRVPRPVDELIYIDPHGEAPFWPLTHDVHHRADPETSGGHCPCGGLGCASCAPLQADEVADESQVVVQPISHGEIKENGTESTLTDEVQPETARNHVPQSALPRALAQSSSTARSGQRDREEHQSRRSAFLDDLS